MTDNGHGTATGRTETQQQRLDQLLDSALAEADPLVANLAVLNADFSRLSRRLVEIVQRLLDETVEDTVVLNEMLPAIDRAAKVTNISERLTSWIAKQRSSK